MPQIIQKFALQKVQLSEKVHHWTPDGPYGSKDLKFPINVPTKLSSFDVGFLIATVFGKLKLPRLVPKVLLCEETRCVLWEDKMCVL